MKDTEDLLKILEELEGAEQKQLSQKQKDKPLQATVRRFINHYKIKQGNTKIPTYVLYYAYFQFCKDRNYKRYSKIEFGRNMSTKFKKKRDGRQRYYMVDSALDLTKEYIGEAKKHDEKWKRWKAKEKSKQKK